MLDRTAYTTLAPDVRIISGLSLAHTTRMTPQQRVAFGADLVRGRATVLPWTQVQAGRVLSIPSLAIGKLLGNRSNRYRHSQAKLNTSNIHDLWGALGTNEREAFVGKHLIELWDAIERVTA